MTAAHRRSLHTLSKQTFGPSSWENVDGWEEGGTDIAEYHGVTVSIEGTLIRIKLIQNNVGLANTMTAATAATANVQAGSATDIM